MLTEALEVFKCKDSSCCGTATSSSFPFCLLTLVLVIS